MPSAKQTKKKKENYCDATGLMPSKGELLGYVCMLSCTTAQGPRPLFSSYHVFYHFLAAAPPPASSLAHLQTSSNPLPLPSLPAP